MQEHPAIRFLWLLPLAIVLLIAVVLLWSGTVDGQSGKAIGGGWLFVFFAALASGAFYQREIKPGILFLGLTMLQALLLLDLAFGVLQALPELPIWMREYAMIAGMIVVLVLAPYAAYKSNHLPAVAVVGFFICPIALILLVWRTVALIGWW